MACGHSNVSKSVKHTLHATSTHTNRDRRRPHRQQIRKLNGINLNEFRSLCVFVTDQNRQTPYGGREKFSILNLRLFFYSISTHIHRKYIFSNSQSERTFDVPEQFCKHQIHGIWPYSPQNIINITITWYLYSISSERREIDFCHFWLSSNAMWIYRGPVAQIGFTDLSYLIFYYAKQTFAIIFHADNFCNLCAVARLN